MKSLTEEEFDKQFTPVPDGDGEVVRPGDAGLNQSSDKLWTIVDGDDGGLYAVSGWHYVNRVGYLITEESWVEDTEAVWCSPNEEVDEEDADEEIGSTR